MAPYLFALLLLAQDAPAAEPSDSVEVAAPADGPVATAVPRKQTVAPLPIQGGPVSAPTDDYGYVGWCYGVMASYVDLYDLAMPEVERIERAWPTPSTEENIKIIYPGQRAEARENLKIFQAAMEAAEKASPTAIHKDGEAAIKKGRAVWTGATTVPKAQLAQFWMSWSPPAKCEETAKSLTERSNLFGQALGANAPEPEVEPEAEPAKTADADADEDAAPSAIDDLMTSEPPAEAPAQPADQTAEVKLRGPK